MIDEIRERFIEQIGLVAQNEGMPRIAGRLMGLMVFDGRAYSFSELARELQVSRGSISANARLLEDRGVIQRTTKPGDRQDFFQLSEDPYARILRDAVERTRKAGDVIGKTVAALPAGHDDIRGRLEEYERFYDVITECVGQAAGRLTK